MAEVRNNRSLKCDFFPRNKTVVNHEYQARVCNENETNSMVVKRVEVAEIQRIRMLIDSWIFDGICGRVIDLDRKKIIETDVYE